MAETSQTLEQPAAESFPVCPDCDGYSEVLVSGDPRSDNFVTEECRTCLGEGRLYPDIVGQERYEELLDRIAEERARQEAINRQPIRCSCGAHSGNK